MALSEKLELIEPENTKVSLRTQCALLQLNRSTFYFQLNKNPEVSEKDEYLMKKIDRIFTEFPYYGSRRIAKQLSRDLKEKTNRKRIQRLMRIMGIEAIYPKPRLSKPEPGHTIYPYLLKGVKAKHPNHIWGVDITYIPLSKGWLYLFAILDWFSRYVVSWELSDSLATEFCTRALEKALEHNTPDIHNSDQGSQLTSNEYVGVLKSHSEIKISMDSRGRFFDNIFTERLWRSVKYEEVYLHDYQSPADARESLTKYFDTYNNRRLHQSLKYMTPEEVYYGSK